MHSYNCLRVKSELPRCFHSSYFFCTLLDFSFRLTHAPFHQTEQVFRLFCFTHGSVLLETWPKAERSNRSTTQILQYLEIVFITWIIMLLYKSVSVSQNIQNTARLSNKTEYKWPLRQFLAEPSAPSPHMPHEYKPMSLPSTLSALWCYELALQWLAELSFFSVIVDFSNLEGSKCFYNNP